MQFKCKICNERFSAAGQRLRTLCEKCTGERKQYLSTMESNFPFLDYGTIKDEGKDTLIFERMPTVSDRKVNCYQRINIPGKNTSVLGKGSYGEVWLVQHRITKEQFALKVIHKQILGNTHQTKNLQREIEIQQRISHNNIIKVYDVMADRENIYILMEYADGGNLFRYIRKKKRLSEREAYKFFVQIASAINFLHKNSLLHRDIKPENILLSENETVKLCDFGCCTSCDEKVGRYFLLSKV